MREKTFCNHLTAHNFLYFHWWRSGDGFSPAFSWEILNNLNSKRAKMPILPIWSLWILQQQPLPPQDVSWTDQPEAVNYNYTGHVSEHQLRQQLQQAACFKYCHAASHAPLQALGSKFRYILPSVKAHADSRNRISETGAGQQRSFGLCETCIGLSVSELTLTVSIAHYLCGERQNIRGFF